MADDQQAQNIPESTQDSAMPTDNQQTTPTEQVPQGESQVEQGLPDGVKERTAREFEKLQTQLRDERRKRELAESAFSSMRTKEEKPQVVPIYDPNTGLLNEQALNDTQNRTYQAEQRALKAEQAVQSWQEEMDRRETYSAHPTLNPQAKDYDETFDKLTASIWYGSQISPDRWGKQLSTKEAADQANEILSKGSQKAREQGAQEAIERLTPKEQASMSAQGNPGRRTQVSNNLEDLQAITRKGGKASEQALVERLKGVPWG